MRLSIATKVFIAFACLVVIFTGVLMFGVYRTQTLFRQIERLNRRIVPVSLALSDAQTDLKSFNILLNERDPLIIRRTLQVARLAHSLPDRIEERVGRARNMLERPELEDGQTTPPLPHIRQRLDSLVDRTEDFAERSRTFTGMVLEESPTDQSEDEIAELQSTLRSDARKLDEAIASVRSDLRDATDQALERADDNERSSLYALGLLSGAALLFSVGVLFAVIRIVRPLTTLTEATKRVGEGDYRPIENIPENWLGTDEITLLAREFNSMADKLARRDEKLREQHEALLKSERLATVGRMTSLITHELRNPLSSINLNTEMLLETLVEYGIDRDDPEVMPLLETIIDEVDRLRDITEEYLVYARLPSPDLEPHNLSDIIYNLIEFHLGEWQREGVDIDLDVNCEDIDVQVDPNHLRQALLNIVKNAIEASPRDSTVDLSVDCDDRRAYVDIRDRGPGIDEDVHDKIFDPFFTTKSEGTGLGLAMTQQIIEEHHGVLRIEEPEGGGCRFVIELPRSTQEIEQSDLVVQES